MQIRLANELNLPLKVVFRLDASFPEANFRHFDFLIQGLKDFASGVSLLGCEFEIRTGTLEEGFPGASFKCCLCCYRQRVPAHPARLVGMAWRTCAL